MCNAAMIHPYRMTEPAQSSTAEGVQNALLSSPSPNFLICYLVFLGDAQYAGEKTDTIWDTLAQYHWSNG